MTFSKPNMKYTEMAIWIDQNVYKPDCDDNLVYKYIYNLVYMQAHQLALFRKFEDYDEFALYCASRLLLRIRTKDDQIKSILNYIKSVICSWRADYEREFHIESSEYDVIHVGCFDLGDHLSDIAGYHDRSAYAFTCNDIEDVVHKHLCRIPQRRRSAEWHNIYISCMLTLNDRLLYSMEVVKNRKYGNMFDLISDAFKASRTRDPILFHLEESMSNYVHVLVNEIIHAISNELSEELDMRISAANSMKSLIHSALSADEDD